MNTAVTTTATPGSTNATPIPTCYTYPVDRRSGAGSEKGGESLRVLLLCLHGIAAFCWAASRRALERTLLAYLQSTVNPAWRSFIASLTGATASQGVSTCPTPTHEAQALHDDTGDTVTHQAGGACANSKTVSWTYMRGAWQCTRRRAIWLIVRGEMWLSAGVSLALSDLCQDRRYGGGRIPLFAILDLSACRNFPVCA